MTTLAEPATKPVFTFALQALPDYADRCWFENVFSREEIARILRIADTFPDEIATVGTNRLEDEHIRRSRVRWLHVTEETTWIFQRLGDLMSGANDARYRFEISGFHEGLQVAEYGPGAFFNWHK